MKHDAIMWLSIKLADTKFKREATEYEVKEVFAGLINLSDEELVKLGALYFVPELDN